MLKTMFFQIILLFSNFGVQRYYPRFPGGVSKCFFGVQGSVKRRVPLELESPWGRDSGGIGVSAGPRRNRQPSPIAVFPMTRSRVLPSKRGRQLVGERKSWKPTPREKEGSSPLWGRCGGVSVVPGWPEGWAVGGRGRSLEVPGHLARGSIAEEVNEPPKAVLIQPWGNKSRVITEG